MSTENTTEKSEEILQPEKIETSGPSLADLTKSKKPKAKVIEPEPMVHPEGFVPGVLGEIDPNDPQSTVGVTNGVSFENHVPRIIALEQSEDALGTCPVCDFDICTKVATVDGKPLLKCHHCESLWRPDAPTEKLKAVTIHDTLTVDGGIAHVGNLIQDLQEISDSMKPGQILYFIDHRFHSGLSFGSLDYQQFCNHNPRVIPTKDGLALAARYVGFELVDFQSPAIVVRKPVQD